jgi:hypothetical protein
VNRVATDITRAITPPSLFGIDRRIALQIGSTILVGCVLMLVVGLLVCSRLSGSPSIYGSFRVHNVTIVTVTANPRWA